MSAPAMKSFFALISIAPLISLLLLTSLNTSSKSPINVGDTIFIFSFCESIQMVAIPPFNSNLKKSLFIMLRIF